MGIPVAEAAAGTGCSIAYKSALSLRVNVQIDRIVKQGSLIRRFPLSLSPRFILL